jgi:hypothetical protein
MSEISKRFRGKNLFFLCHRSPSRKRKLKSSCWRNLDSTFHTRFIRHVHLHFPNIVRQSIEPVEITRCREYLVSSRVKCETQFIANTTLTASCYQDNFRHFLRRSRLYRAWRPPFKVLCNCPVQTRPAKLADPSSPEETPHRNSVGHHLPS